MNDRNPLTLLTSTDNPQSNVDPGGQHEFASESGGSETAQPRQQNTGRKARRPGSKRSRTKFIKQLKTWFQTKLGGLDTSTVKLILIACGVTAAVALAVIALAKFLPLGVALLALLGLGALLSLWDRMRYIIIYPRA
jgi:Flp pilus assembly protein TadB